MSGSNKTVGSCSLPITNVLPTKPPYFSNLADGQKNMAPNEYSPRPIWIPLCFYFEKPEDNAIGKIRNLVADPTHLRVVIDDIHSYNAKYPQIHQQTVPIQSRLP